MTHFIHDLAVAPLARSLNNLDAILAKAEEYAAADDYLDPETLVSARLFANMAPLSFQIQVATDTAKGAAARLSGNDVPSWPDEERTLADLRARLTKTTDYLQTFEPADFDGAESRAITLKLGPTSVDFSGTGYINSFVLPNFFFHVTTAYNILRHNGLVVGKRDYLGGPNQN